MKATTKYYFIFILVLFRLITSAQNQKLDSLKNALKIHSNYKDKIITYLGLSQEFSSTPDSGIFYSTQAINLARKNSDSLNVVKGYILLSSAQYYKGDLKQSLNSLKISENILASGIILDKLIIKDLLADVFTQKGVVLNEVGEYANSLDAYLKALNIREHLADSKKMALIYSNIGSLYSNQSLLDKDLYYQLKAKEISEKIGDKNTLLYALNDIGVVYAKKNDLDSAEIYFRLAIDVSIEINNNKMESALLSNIGNIYFLKKNYKTAIIYFKKAKIIGENIAIPLAVIGSMINLSSCFLKIEQLDSAKFYADKAYKIAKTLNSKQKISACYQIFVQIYLTQKDYKNAHLYEKMNSQIKDTLFNESSSKQITEMQTKYDTEKKEQQITLLHKEGEIQVLSIKKQKTIIYSVIGGLVLVVLFAVFIYRAWNITKKQKHIISLQKDVVEQKSQELFIKNKQIADSIDYAQNIQQAILPSPEKIEELLPSSFIFFEPKDVVSGDFYWLQRVTNAKNENIVLFAAIDCTGHGVPGAFVSLMAFNFLEKVVTEHGIFTPSEILNELNKEVIQVLRKKEQTSSTKYGMDMSLISWNKNTNKIIYSGARNPLYIVTDNQLTQLEANRISIGTSPDFVFIQQEIQVQKGDMLYLFTDGYADQKGEENGKKFYYPPFRKLLEENASKPVDDQKRVLQETFVRWKGKSQQIDDVLVVGIST